MSNPVGWRVTALAGTVKKGSQANNNWGSALTLNTPYILGQNEDVKLETSNAKAQFSYVFLSDQAAAVMRIVDMANNELIPAPAYVMHPWNTCTVTEDVPE